jgi:hypothetical protein
MMGWTRTGMAFEPYNANLKVKENKWILCSAVIKVENLPSQFTAVHGPRSL